ncbi:Hypothetical protein, putative [Bodo saltans]|uniref:Bardet-Biedl syndrome 2 protein homolog n=1 Tax=Bodo saltans TaxID=75058 RepID=A0A0S4JJZ6_BODSA|nr:Hypothetical protein, putative [Bodo saltans]|eukprot:CUG90518.1 Hypothetical protein, putative [Bodo saltans]
MSSLKLGTVYQFSTSLPILEGLATVGKFDGKHASLACATLGHRVTIHDSTPQDADAPSVRALNVNKEVTALVAGSFDKAQNDALVIGSATTISAYNVEKNSDLFYKENSDGVFSATMGQFGGESLLFVGGSCNTFALDSEGNEKYWGVTGANVSSLALVNGWRVGNSEAQTRLISGSEDNELRCFDGTETTTIATEGDKVIRLAAAPKGGRFAYALANGTIGVYEQNERQWRIKAKARPTSFAFVDVDFDGVPELVCTWSDGTVEIRRDIAGGQGDILFKDQFGSPATAVVAADYRGDGRVLPMVCTYDGEVRGLATMESTMEELAENKEKMLLESLIQEKQQLQFDLKNLESQVALQKAQKAKDPATPADTNPPPNSVMLNANTSVKLRLRPMSETKSIDLCITASDGAVIRGALVTGELIFPAGSDSAFFHAETPQPTLSCPICLDKDVGTELTLSVLVGSPLSDVYQVHDLKFRLPRFSMHVPVQELPRIPTGFVTARISERSGRYHAWLATCFNATTQPDTDFRACFVCLRDRSGLEVSASSNNGGEFTVRCDNMQTCGDIIQDLGAFLGLKELESVADFPNEFETFQHVLQRVEEYNNVRMKLTAEIADSTQMVKALVIKAEDARILNDMRNMKKMYGSLYEVNRELMGEYLKRSNNHNELLAALKEVNTMIQKAGQLRLGQAKQRLINECRSAIKANNIHSLFHIIKTGKTA